MRILVAPFSCTFSYSSKKAHVGSCTGGYTHVGVILPGNLYNRPLGLGTNIVWEQHDAMVCLVQSVLLLPGDPFLPV